MKHTYFLALLFSAFTTVLHAQETLIDTVYISDIRLKDAEKSQKIIRISKDELLNNPVNLSEVLRFQTPFYIRENGRGMAASPSFRGTTAQQTAFLWNGIPVNSLFLGQADVNNIGLLNYDHIAVKPGGGSISYGTGAVGGSVHLNNSLSFNKGFNGDLFAEYGSFETLNSSVKLNYNTDKVSFQLNTAYTESENDYEVPALQYVNRNGKYRQQSFGLSSGYRFNTGNVLYFHSQMSDGLRYFPVFFEEDTKTKYLTQGFRSLLHWDHQNQHFSNHLKLAFLEEQFRHFADIEKTESTGSGGQLFMVKNDASWTRIKNLVLILQTEFQHQKAEGFQSGKSNPKRNLGAAALVVKKQWGKSIYTEGAIRKDFIENMNSPLLFSFGSQIKAAPFYTIKLNISKNFRIPTFNDLYWEPGGNPDLKPEHSVQIELGNEFQYKNFTVEIVPYYLRVSDLIQWMPGNTIWTPFNTNEAESYGAEVYGNFFAKIGNHQLKLKSAYTYTLSKDLETQKSLMYVPKHKFSGTASFMTKFGSIFIQGMFTGLTFTSTDENRRTALNPSTVINAGVQITLSPHLQLGIRANNIFNEVYQTSQHYPMPFRNFGISLRSQF